MVNKVSGCDWAKGVVKEWDARRVQPTLASVPAPRSSAVVTNTLYWISCAFFWNSSASSSYKRKCNPKTTIGELQCRCLRFKPHLAQTYRFKKLWPVQWSRATLYWLRSFKIQLGNTGTYVKRSTALNIGMMPASENGRWTLLKRMFYCSFSV